MPETTQDRAGPRFLLQMRLDRARHADRAEQERNEADEIQKAVKIFQRGAEIPFSFRYGVVFQAQL